MIVGVGVDICEVERIGRAVQKGAFLERYFTEEERAYLAERGSVRDQSAAGIFAAKEAMLKALGTGLLIPLRDVGVSHTEAGAPQAVLAGAAAARLSELGGARMHLSISHDGGMAVAMAVAEG